MTEAMLTLVIKGGGMVLLIIGGFVQIFYGHKLYRSTSELGPERATIRLGNFNATTNSVGAFVMSTAALWAWAAVVISPNLKKDGEKIEVVSISTPNVRFESPALPAPPPFNAAKNDLKDPSVVKSLFAESVKLAEKDQRFPGLVELNRNPARIDLGTLQTLTTEAGSVLVTARVVTDTDSARVAYAPQIRDDQVEFVPAGVAVQSTPRK